MSKVLYTFIAVQAAYGVFSDSQTNGFRPQQMFPNEEYDLQLALEMSRGRVSDDLNAQLEDHEWNAAIVASLETAYCENEQDKNTSNGLSTQNERSSQERIRELQAKAAEERALASQNRGIGDEVKRHRIAARATSRDLASASRSGQPQATQASSSSPAGSASNPLITRSASSSWLDQDSHSRVSRRSDRFATIFRKMIN